MRGKLNNNTIILYLCYVLQFSKYLNITLPYLTCKEALWDRQDEYYLHSVEYMNWIGSCPSLYDQTQESWLLVLFFFKYKFLLFFFTFLSSLYFRFADLFCPLLSSLPNSCGFCAPSICNNFIFPSSSFFVYWEVHYDPSDEMLYFRAFSPNPCPVNKHF